MSTRLPVRFGPTQFAPENLLLEYVLSVNTIVDETTVRVEGRVDRGDHTMRETEPGPSSYSLTSRQETGRRIECLPSDAERKVSMNPHHQGNRARQCFLKSVSRTVRDRGREFRRLQPGEAVSSTNDCGGGKGHRTTWVRVPWYDFPEDWPSSQRSSHSCVNQREH